MREAGSLVSEAGVTARTVDQWVEHTCLAQKARAAEAVGEEALRRAGSSTAVAALDQRLSRNALAASSALTYAAAMLRSLPAWEARAATPESARAQHRPSSTAFPPFLTRVLPVALAIAVGVVLVFSWQQAPPLPSPAGEGVLAGIPDLRTASGAPARSAMPSAAPSAAAGRLIDFDELVMGGGIGSDWRQTAGLPGSIELAAYPTAIDRSVRMVAIAGGRAEACLVATGLSTSSTAIAVDVRLAPGDAPASAELTVLAPDEAAALRVVVEGESTAAEPGTTGVLTAVGVEAGTWYRLEIRPGPDGPRLEVAVREAGSQATDQAIEAPWPAELGGICLAVRGEPGAAINYDNVSIAAFPEGG